MLNCPCSAMQITKYDSLDGYLFNIRMLKLVCRLPLCSAGEHALCISHSMLRT
jgi:hypothetical protein